VINSNSLQFEILGIKINRLLKDEVVDMLDNIIGNNNKICVCIANAHTLNLAYEDMGYLDCLKNFYVLNDGIGVSIASRILYGKDLPDNLNGTDLVPYYLKNSKMSIKLFLLGGNPGIVELAAEKFKNQFNNISIVGYNHGYFNHFNDDNILKEINKSGANILLVALGNQLQERWIYKFKDKLNVNVMVGVGALFDFIANVIPRAPILVRKLKFEWLFRLIIEPKRLWRRYIIGNPLFLIRVLKQKINQIGRKNQSYLLNKLNIDVKDMKKGIKH
jgi:alpha-1,3-mannosyltransferase